MKLPGRMGRMGVGLGDPEALEGFLAAHGPPWPAASWPPACREARRPQVGDNFGSHHPIHMVVCVGWLAPPPESCGSPASRLPGGQLRPRGQRAQETRQSTSRWPLRPPNLICITENSHCNHENTTVFSHHHLIIDKPACLRRKQKCL